MSTKPFTHTPRPPSRIPEEYSNQRWFRGEMPHKPGKPNMGCYIDAKRGFGEIQINQVEATHDFNFSTRATADEMEEFARVLIDTAAYLRSLDGGRP